MLVLHRKSDQSIVLGNDIVISVISIEGGRVRLGISAPVDVPIRRGELPAQNRHGRLSPARLTTSCGEVVAASI